MKKQNKLLRFEQMHPGYETWTDAALVWTMCVQGLSCLSFLLGAAGADAETGLSLVLLIDGA